MPSRCCWKQPAGPSRSTRCLTGCARCGIADAGAARVDLDAAGRPRTVQQDGWTIEFFGLDTSRRRPARKLPQRIEARNGEAKVRLLVDQWTVSP
uniref:lipoprotein insertase outer membrane protein LolB n=1 Tax=Massilia oculi TaxID=945844 RepID=UPI0036D2FC40